MICCPVSVQVVSAGSRLALLLVFQETGLLLQLGGGLFEMSDNHDAVLSMTD